MKTEVYSWRLSADLKAGLQREAQRRKLSLSAVLDLAARDWLSKVGSDIEDDDAQLHLRKAALECFGAFAGGSRPRSENVRGSVRERLRRHYGR